MSRGQKLVRACLKLSDTSFSIVQPVTNINVIEPYSQVITDRAEPDTKMNPITLSTVFNNSDTYEWKNQTNLTVYQLDEELSSVINEVLTEPVAPIIPDSNLQDDCTQLELVFSGKSDIEKSESYENVVSTKYNIIENETDLSSDSTSIRNTYHSRKQYVPINL